MKKLIEASFNQNPIAKEKLLATAGKILTHNQDKGIWKTEFPRLLMEYRDSILNKNSKNTKKNQIENSDLSTESNFDIKLHKKIEAILKKLYPNIKLNYTAESIKYTDANGNIMNQQEVDNKIKVGLKVVEALNDLGSTKPAKHGGTSQPVLSTIRLSKKLGITKKLAAKGVSKEQIEFMFEFMKQNNIGEINSKELAERVMFGLVQPVEVSTTKKAISNPQYNEEEDTYEPITDRELIDENSSYYADLIVPGGTNYKEMEIATPNVEAEKKGHAAFATDKGIGWYRVDDEAQSESKFIVPKKDFTLNKINYKYNIKKDSFDMYSEQADGYFANITRKDLQAELLANAKTGVSDGTTLRVLEMQSDMFQKMKDQDLATKERQISQPFVTASGGYGSPKRAVTTELNVAMHQMLNTDNKWVKFFIQSIVQDAQKKGYKNIRFPSGETAAKVEGHDSIAERIGDIDTKIIRVKKEIVSLRAKKNKSFNMEKYIKDTLEDILYKQSNAGYWYGRDSKEFTNFNEKIKILKSNNIKVIENEFSEDIKEYKQNIDPLRNKIKELNEYQEARSNLKTQGIEKLAPIEGFYQVRVRNTLMKTYGRENVKTVTDKHGNTWFEVALDAKRDSNIIMLQQGNGEILGQADMEAGTVLINSLLQRQDTLPHEYAHHYINMFRDAPIVKEAIKKWGSEEALVQAIGEQVVKQKGEAWNWWKKFSKWVKGFISNLDAQTKEDLKNLLTDSFLTNMDLNKYVEKTKEWKTSMQAAISDKDAKIAINNVIENNKEC